MLAHGSAAAWVAHPPHSWRVCGALLPPTPPTPAATRRRTAAPEAAACGPRAHDAITPAAIARRPRRRATCRAEAQQPGSSGGSSSSSGGGGGGGRPQSAPTSTAGPAAASAAAADPSAATWAWASAISRRVNLDLALTEAVESALTGCGAAEPDLAVVFASSAYAQSLDLLVPLLRRLLPTARVIIGTTGFGVLGPAARDAGGGDDGDGGGGGAAVPGTAARHDEVEHAPAVAVALGALPGVELALRHVQQPDLPDGDAPPDAWAKLAGLPLEPALSGGPSNAAAGPDGATTSFIVISDPSFTQIEELLAGLDFAFPAAKKVGGLSSSGRLSGARALFSWSASDAAAGGAALDDSGVRRGGAVVLGLRGPLTMELMIAQGCRPLSRHVYTVAALDPGHRNVITSVTDAATGASYAPVDALRRDLSDPLQPIASERDLAHVVSNLCCGLAPPEDVFAAPRAPPSPAAAAASEATTEYLIRGMALTGPAHLAVGDGLRLGQSFRFMVRDADGARADLAAHGTGYKRRQLAATLAGRPEPPALGALLFSCNGRGAGLYGEESYDTRQVASYVGAPVAGFQCNGEIGSVGGSTKLHGFTAAVAILRAGVAASGSNAEGSSEAGGGGGSSSSSSGTSN